MHVLLLLALLHHSHHPVHPRHHLPVSIIINPPPVAPWPGGSVAHWGTSAPVILNPPPVGPWPGGSVAHWPGH